MKTRRVLLLALAALGVSASGAAAQSSAPGPKPLFGVRAALLGKTTLEGNHFAFDVAPGAELDDALVVSSFAEQPLVVRLYSADLIAAKDGALAPTQEAQPPSGAGAWIAVGQSAATLVPRGEQTVPFHLAVPPTAGPGDYPGAVVVALDSDSAPGSLAVQSRVALTVRVRVLGTTVLGRAQRRLVVGRVQHRLGGGRRERLSVDVRNVGRFLFDLDATVRVGKASVQLTPRDIYVIPRGHTTLTATSWKAPIAGRRCLHAEVRTRAHGLPTMIDRGPTSCIWFVPWIAVGSALVSGLALVALLYGTRQRRRERRGDRAEARRLVAQRRAARR